MRESPESLITPPTLSPDDHKTQRYRWQSYLPGIDLELCDKCRWSCTCLDIRRMVDSCPLCGTHISHIPVTEEEVCLIKFDDEQGLIIEFNRKKLL